MSRRKTHKEFIAELNLINPNVEVLSEYCMAHEKIKCRCKIDGYVWNVVPNSLLKGHGCPRCSKKERYTTESFIFRMKEINPNIKILSEYKGAPAKIKCICKIDGFEWSTLASHLLYGIGCPKCGGVATKNTEQFKDELYEIDPYIDVLGEYTGSKNRILCRCLRDNKTWSSTPNALLEGNGCPHCSSSKGEKTIAMFLDSVSIPYIREYRFDNCRNKHTLPFDFYLHSLNTVIEYDGQHHFYPVNFGGVDKGECAIKRYKRTKTNDSIKNKYCKENGIRIIRIPYTEFESIENILDKYLL